MTHIIPDFISVRDYQKQAIRAWFNQNGHGLFEMATGTGKTITALSASASLFKEVNRLAIIIVTPFSQLSTQWMQDCRNFGLQPVKAFENKKKWEPLVDDLINGFNNRVIDCISIVTTNATFIGKAFQEKLNSIKNPVLLIIDEAHYFGAKELSRTLPEHVRFRLALTATPNRWMDEEGTEKLMNYFGGRVTFQYGLKEAIQAGFLTEYNYYPLIVNLTPDESDEYIELTVKIKKLAFMAQEDPQAREAMNSLAIRRARIVYSAQNKMVVLKQLLNEKDSIERSLFYCGDGKVEDDGAAPVRQVDKVVSILRNEFGHAAMRYTSNESNQIRSEILAKFEKGSIDALVAIKCLDEGIDVPSTQNAYLISSTSNPKEFIQRRGRVLRKHPDKKYANIYDFIVVPPDFDDVEDTIFNSERDMLVKELNRFMEFANLALNGPEAEQRIWKLKQKYNLLDQ